MAPPGFDQDLRLGQGVEDLPVQELVAHRAVEALAVVIFPWAARLPTRLAARAGLCCAGRVEADRVTVVEPEVACSGDDEPAGRHARRFAG